MESPISIFLGCCFAKKIQHPGFNILLFCSLYMRNMFDIFLGRRVYSGSMFHLKKEEIERRLSFS